MGPQLAVVVLPTWQWVLLIVLCFGSLIIGLYCLLFMVPLKSFVERINSLGGGMKGIRSYVEGVRSETEERIAAVQEQVAAGLKESQTELRSAVDSAAQKAGQAQAGLQRLERAAQSLQAELRDNASAVRDLSAGLAAMRKESEELRSDFEALQSELRGSVDQKVSDSYQQLEGTVLSALEALKDGMLRAATAQHPPSATHVPRPTFEGSPAKDPRRRQPDKIIRAEPLFAVLEKAKGNAAKRLGKDAGEGVPDSQEHPAPAK